MFVLGVDALCSFGYSGGRSPSHRASFQEAVRARCVAWLVHSHFQLLPTNLNHATPRRLGLKSRNRTQSKKHSRLLLGLISQLGGIIQGLVADRHDELGDSNWWAEYYKESAILERQWSRQ